MQREKQGGLVASLGGGAALIFLAKFLAVVSGYAILLGLGMVLDAVAFGNYGTITSFITPLNMVIIVGTVQGAAKFISENPARAGQIQRMLFFRVHTLLAGGIFLVYLVVSPKLAAWQNAPELTLYFRLSALIFLFYAFYGIFIGRVNGEKRFHVQAGFDITYSCVKTALILLMAWAGLGLAGAVGGFAVASGVIFFLAAAVIGFAPADPAAEPVGAAQILKFTLPQMGFIFMQYLIMNIDFWRLREMAGIGHPDYAGFYYAILNIARVPFLAVISVTFVVFPMISKVTFEQDHLRTHKTITSCMRFACVLVLALATHIAACPDAWMNLLFPKFAKLALAPDFASTLRILTVGNSFLAIALIGSTLISGSGRPGYAMIFAGGAAAIDYGLNTLLIPRAGFAPDGAAQAAAAAMLAWLVAVAAYVVAVHRAFLSPATVVRLIMATAGAAYWSHATAHLFTSKLLIIAHFFMNIGVFLGILIILREITQVDMLELKHTFRRS